LLEKFVRRNGHRDLARLRLDQAGKREDAAINDSGKDSEDREESKKTRHGFRMRAASATVMESLKSELTMADLAVHNKGASREAKLAAALKRRSIVLVGMMGAGKSSIGRRLSQRLAIPFSDADAEIEAAAGMTVPEIFELRGEAEFRTGEARVIARLLEGGPQVLATGGGAFMSADTRSLVRIKAVSVWLKADFDVLMKRIKRRNDRPMLKTPDPAATLRTLISERYPFYAQADITVESRDVLHDVIVDEIIAALCGLVLDQRPDAGAPS
jgi:shikimate kinase